MLDNNIKKVHMLQLQIKKLIFKTQIWQILNFVYKKCHICDFPFSEKLKLMLVKAGDVFGPS